MAVVTPGNGVYLGKKEGKGTFCARVTGQLTVVDHPVGICLNQGRLTVSKWGPIAWRRSVKFPSGSLPCIPQRKPKTDTTHDDHSIHSAGNESGM